MNKITNRDLLIRDRWISTNGDYPVKGKAQYFAIHFSSSEAFIDYCKTNEPKPDSQSASKRAGGLGSSWVDTTTYSQAIRFAENGSEHHTEKFQEAAQEYGIGSIVGQNHILVNEHAVAGGFVDTVAYSVGDPECMITPQMKADTPIINISVCINGCCGIKTDTFFNRGVAILGLIDQIESTGLATVELNLFSVNRTGNKHWMVSYPIKGAGQSVDMAKLGFLLCSSSTLRRFDFRMTENLPTDELIKATRFGYGSPALSDGNVDKAITDADSFLDNADIIFASNSNMSLNEAREYATKQALQSSVISELIS